MEGRKDEGRKRTSTATHLSLYLLGTRRWVRVLIKRRVRMGYIIGLVESVHTPSITQA